MNIAYLLNSDCVYKQNPDQSYIIQSDGTFKELDINIIVDGICAYLNDTFTKMEKTKPFLSNFKIQVNYINLKQCLFRYSRDIFGQKRLLSQISRLDKHISKEQLGVIENYCSEYGFKISSSSPYLHRKVSYLLYWFSVLKPFSLEFVNGDCKEIDHVLVMYFNEYAAFCIANILITSFTNKDGKQLNINRLLENKDFLQELLYDLHFRNLSRSSLEFFLWTYI